MQPPFTYKHLRKKDRGYQNQFAIKQYGTETNDNWHFGARRRRTLFSSFNTGVISKEPKFFYIISRYNRYTNILMSIFAENRLVHSQEIKWLSE